MSQIAPNNDIHGNTDTILKRTAAAICALSLCVGFMGTTSIHASSRRDTDLPRASRAVTVQQDTLVSADGSISYKGIMQACATELAASTPGSRIKVRNGKTVSYDILSSLTVSAEKAKKNLTLYADTTEENSSSVQGRLYIPLNPESLTGRGSVRLGVYTGTPYTAPAAKIFQSFFTNQVAVVHMAHSGPFGGRVEVAAKADLTGLSRDHLSFHVYNKSENTYNPIELPDYYFDAKGYLHFYTYEGGDIVITDRALELR